MHLSTKDIPATLSLDTMPSTTVNCTEVLRDLPGKRLVCSGRWENRPVLVKLFLHPRHAERHWQREKNGVDLLARHQIATPELLYAGQLNDHTPILIFAYLDGACTALEQWQHIRSLSDDTERLQLLRQLVTLIARQHNCGLWQQDLHLDNFLLHQGTLYTIDGDGIGSTKERMNINQRRQNLALFLAQTPPQFEHLFTDVLECYAACPKVPKESNKSWISIIEHELPQARNKRRHDYVKKSYRNCTEFACQRTSGQLILHRRDIQPELLQQLLTDPDDLMARGTLLKDGNSATVVKVELDGQYWVIKRYNIKNFWHALKRCWRPTRASVSWGNAHRLKISDIATPQAVAMIEKRFGPLRRTGYYVCEFVEAPSVAELYHPAAELSTTAQRVTADNLIQLFTLFFRLGIYHGDCKATNFLVRQSTPWVIDLDAMCEFRRRSTFIRRFHNDRQRFLRNWPSTSALYRRLDERLPR